MTRVKDRKLNEILIFASIAKMDQENIDEYIDIIEMLCDDVNGCDALLDTDGQAEIALEPIGMQEYRCRLSPSEAEDEDAFNALKVAPVYEQPELLYVKQLISDAVASIRSECPASPDIQSDVARLEAENSKNLKIILQLEEERNRLFSENEDLKKSLESISLEIDSLKDCSVSEISQCKDALAALKEEVATLRTRNEQLSAQLDYCQESVATVESERDELRAVVAELTSSSDGEEADPDTAEAEPVAAEPSCAETSGCEDSAEPEQPKPSSFDSIITDRQRALLTVIMEMKSKKIDEFIDKSFSGAVSEDASEDIVAFLKDDIRICELILALDCSSFESTVAGLKAVLDAVESSTESRYQKIYLKSLDDVDKLIEDNYVDILSTINAVISARYLPYVRGSGA